MNKVLAALVLVLTLAVGFLFYKVYSGSAIADESAEAADSTKVEAKTPAKEKLHVDQIATTPTGKIAFIDIDRLYEESAEANDLISESTRKMGNLEQRFASLEGEYANKVEEFQRNQQAGILPESELENKAKDIQRIENEAKNVRIMMDNLKMDVDERSAAYRQKLKEFLVKWNEGRYDFILSYSDAVPSMLLGNSSLEVTNEVSKALNDDYKATKKSKKK